MTQFKLRPRLVGVVCSFAGPAIVALLLFVVMMVFIPYFNDTGFIVVGLAYQFISLALPAGAFGFLLARRKKASGTITLTYWLVAAACCFVPMLIVLFLLAGGQPTSSVIGLEPFRVFAAALVCSLIVLWFGQEPISAQEQE